MRTRSRADARGLRGCVDRGGGRRSPRCAREQQRRRTPLEHAHQIGSFQLCTAENCGHPSLTDTTAVRHFRFDGEEWTGSSMRTYVEMRTYIANLEFRSCFEYRLTIGLNCIAPIFKYQ